MRRTSAKASDSKQAIVQAVEAPARFRGDQISLMTFELFNDQTTQKASTWITDMEKLMNPLFIAVAVLAVIAFLQFGLYIGLRREVEAIKKANEGKLKARRETKDSLRAEMLRISEELVDSNPPAAPAVALGQSMNLSRRNQVLRMHLRGDSPSRIAGALKISKSEVDLLLKVHRTVMPPSTWSPTGTVPDGRRVGVMPLELAALSQQEGSGL
jgi:flagellar biosynthesis/type III secretory pathway M-ring protein FliF/YscJ